MKKQKEPGTVRSKKKTGKVPKSSGEVFNDAADAFCGAMTCSIQNTGKVGVSAAEALTDVIDQVVLSTADTDEGLTEGARAVTLGVLHAGNTAGIETLGVLRMASAFFIKRAAALGCDTGTAARGLISGAIEGALELGLDAGSAASHSAVASVKAAFEISSETGDKVLDALKEPVSGIKIVLALPAPGNAGVNRQYSQANSGKFRAEPERSLS